MNTKNCFLAVMLGFGLLGFGPLALAGDDVPRLPGAELVAGWPPYRLILTTPHETVKLQEQGDDTYVSAGMSRDGNLVVSGRSKARTPREMVIVVYSVPENKWREYGEFEGGPLAISPDGSKVAFARSEEGKLGPIHIHVLDLTSGIETTAGPEIGRDVTGLSWSPDEKRIAYGIDSSTPTVPPEYSPTIEVLDVETGNVWKVADGEAPAWSPSGEWIAYIDCSGQQLTSTTVHLNEKSYEYSSPVPDRVSRVRPDGNGAEVLVTLPRTRGFGGLFHHAAPPVWSPDSKKLLLNELYDFRQIHFQYPSAGS